MKPLKVRKAPGSDNTGHRMLSQQEVAEIMTARGCPMTPSRVGQIERKALRKIRRYLLDSGIVTTEGKVIHEDDKV